MAKTQAGQSAGDDVVVVARPQQQHRRVERVDGVVPDQQRQDAEAHHQESDQHARAADFDAADVEGLIRIRGVAESPDESGGDDGGPRASAALSRRTESRTRAT